MNYCEESKVELYKFFKGFKTKLNRVYISLLGYLGPKVIIAHGLHLELLDTQ